MKKVDLKRLAIVSLLIAVEIVFSRFFSIATPIVKISFAFLPVALIGMMYGPVYAGLGAAIADFIGAMLFPIGAFFPGFTLTAFLTGMVYGLFLYNKEKSFVRICTAVLTIAVALNLCLDTLWLQMITGKGYLALFPPRVLKCIIMAPVQVAVIRLAASKRFYPLLVR